MLFSALTTRAPGASGRNSWLVDKFPTSAGVKSPASMKGLVPSIQDLILHFGRLPRVSGTLSHGTEEVPFRKPRPPLFVRSCSRAKLPDNFS